MPKQKKIRFTRVKRQKTTKENQFVISVIQYNRMTGKEFRALKDAMESLLSDFVQQLYNPESSPE